GPSTDVFGLGAILYALLTGRPPFQGDTAREVVDKAKNGEVLPPRQLNRRVPPALERVCLKAMAVDPRRRSSSPAALLRDLGRSLSRTRRRVCGGAVLAGALAAVVPLGWRYSNRSESGALSLPVTNPMTAPELASRAGSILKANCHRCHGENGNVEGSFN